MSDFVYAYFNSELDKLDVPSLERILEKVQFLLERKRSAQNDYSVNLSEVERINAVYDKIPVEEQPSIAHSSMRTMWKAVKNDTWLSQEAPE